MFSNSRRALSQCNSRLRLLYLLNHVAHPTFFSSGEHCDSFSGGTSSSFAVLSVSSDKGTCLSSKVLEKTIPMKNIQEIRSGEKLIKMTFSLSCERGIKKNATIFNDFLDAQILVW